MAVFAFECYADENVYRFLREYCALPLVARHEFGQGPIVTGVFVKRTVDIGLVDEDPGRPHHSERDRAELISRSANVEYRRYGGNHLIIVRPALEECFLRSMRVANLQTELPMKAVELRGLLGQPRGGQHTRFYADLVRLHETSRAEQLTTVVGEIEGLVRTILR